MRVTLAILVVLLWCGCKSETSSTASKQAGAKSALKAAKPKPKAKPPQPIADAEARALFDKWLNAQNKGDFAAYQVLFANTFNGVKRAGKKTSTYDRKKWLEDRGRMFKKKMKVDATDVTVTTSTDRALVNFTQAWSSGTYQDVGPKRLIIVREGNALRISSEEMLESQKVGTIGDWMDGLKTETVKGDTLPKPVAAALLSLGARFTTEGSDPRITWTRRLSPSLLVVEIVASAVRANAGTLMLVRRGEVNLAVADVERIPNGSEQKKLRFQDIDGDGIEDVLAPFGWDFDDYWSRGLALVLTKGGMVSTFVTDNRHENDGLNPEMVLFNDSSFCRTVISGRFAILAEYEFKSYESDEETGEKSNEEVDKGLAAWVLADRKLEETRIFAHWTSIKPDEPAETADAKKPISLDPCRGGRAATISANVTEFVGKLKAGRYDWAGFALTKDEAIARAKADGVDPARVLEFGVAPQPALPY